MSFKPIDYVPPESWLIYVRQTKFPIKGRMGTGQIAMAIYRCKCGKEGEYSVTSVKSGGRLSCGCIRKKPNPLNERHKLSKHPLYRIWAGIKSRCYNKNEKAYPDYGGRGVTMCDEWVDDPEAFIKWALANGWEPGLEIDKDIKAKESGLPGLLYSPETCIFVTKKENCNSRRTSRILTFNGKSQTVQQWSEETGIKGSTIFMRIFKSGYSVEQALTEPLFQSNQRRIGTKYKKR